MVEKTNEQAANTYTSPPGCGHFSVLVAVSVALAGASQLGHTDADFPIAR